MLLQVTPTPTRFPNNSLYTPFAVQGAILIAVKAIAGLRPSLQIISTGSAFRSKINQSKVFIQSREFTILMEDCIIGMRNQVQKRKRHFVILFALRFWRSKQDLCQSFQLETCSKPKEIWNRGTCDDVDC